MKRIARMWAAAFLGVCLASPSMSASNNSQTTKKPVVQKGLPQLSEDQEWSLLLPTDKKIAFHGVVSYDNAGGSTKAMLYPAPNAGGLLVAILAHGLINQAMREREKSKIQKAADVVVEPYESSMANYTYAQLFSAGLSRITGIKLPVVVEPGNKPTTKWVAESLPAYFMTQNSQAIWIENMIVLYDVEAKKKETYLTTVKVLSRNRVNLSERWNYWQADDAQQLRTTFERLLAESVELARQELTQTLAREDSQFETVRYMEGSVERMERGKILRRSCDRIVLKTLRGWIMSVPRLIREDEAASTEGGITNACPTERVPAPGVPASTSASAPIEPNDAAVVDDAAHSAPAVSQ